MYRDKIILTKRGIGAPVEMQLHLTPRRNRALDDFIAGQPDRLTKMNVGWIGDGLCAEGAVACERAKQVGVVERLIVLGAEGTRRAGFTAALRALEHGWTGVHLQNAADRRREFAPKWRFNRALRALVSSPGALRAAALGARVAPGAVRALIARAGDCDLA